MTRDIVITKPFMAQFITWIFIFSTIYTLAFYFYLGIAQEPDFVPIGDTANNAKTTGIIGILDNVLEFISWISPFSLVKMILITLLAGTPEIYEFLNIIFLRPMSWIVAVITVNYLKAWIPTLGGE